MRYKKRFLAVLFLLLLSVLIHIYSNNSLRVEYRYSTGIYPSIAKCLRFFTGWVPFSFGDILYGTLVVWLIWKLFSTIFKLIKRTITMDSLKKGLFRFIFFLLWVYIVFNIFWGINYNRKGIAYQLQLSEKKYTSVELRQLDSLLLQKVNESKIALLHRSDTIRSSKEFFKRAMNAYGIAAANYPFLKYKNSAVKPSMWGWLGNYLGFTGYYNPFTGEAQVNTTVPYFLQPYTTCHEMAHQLGYAKEDEANFVGYLAAAASTDTLFHYSVYLDIFVTTNRNLFLYDSLAAKSFAKQVLPEVKADIKIWRDFNLKHRNPAEPVVQWLYGKYLQNNKQPSGILTYDEVIALLVEYNKKYGKI